MMLKMMWELKTGTHIEGILKVSTKMSFGKRSGQNPEVLTAATGANFKTTQPFNKTHRYLFSVHVYWGLDRISKQFTLSIFCFQILFDDPFSFHYLIRRLGQCDSFYFIFLFISELSFMLYLPSMLLHLCSVPFFTPYWPI